MDAKRSARPAGYLVGWIIVLASAIAGSACAAASFILVWQDAGAVSSPSPSPREFLLGMLRGGVLMGAPAGVLSATICAFMVRHTPPGRIVLPILIPSVIVGVLTGPIFILGSSVCILLAQLVAAGALGGRDEPPRRADPTHCARCRYSLVGLDRAKASVCPECGAALPVLHA